MCFSYILFTYKLLCGFLSASRHSRNISRIRSIRFGYGEAERRRNRQKIRIRRGLLQGLVVLVAIDEAEDLVAV